MKAAEEESKGPVQARDPLQMARKNSDSIDNFSLLFDILANKDKKVKDEAVPLPPTIMTRR